jgi:DNA-3-methyladenine glycosylase II
MTDATDTNVSTQGLEGPTVLADAGPAAPSLALNVALQHLIAADPVLKGLSEQYVTQSIRPDPRLFRTLVRSIVSQQLSGAGAAAIMRRVEALFPEEAPMSAAGLANLDDDTLRATGLSRAKVAALQDLAAHVLDGRLDLERLDELSDEEVIQELVAVRGIGRWTAEMFLIFSLGRPDVLPVDDYGVRNAVKRAYGLEELPNKRDLTTIATPWHPYCSAASLLLWRSLDNRPGR